MSEAGEQTKIFILGAGRVGRAFTSCLQAKGNTPVGIWCRSEAGANRAEVSTGLAWQSGPYPENLDKADAVLLAVSDDAVAHVAQSLYENGLLTDKQAIFHCGGARPAREAMPGLPSEFCLGTLHPLVAVADGQHAMRSLTGAYFAVEGDARAVELGEAIVQAIGARSFRLNCDQMCLYHAAAVVASNHTVALWHHATVILQEAGIDKTMATEVLKPLLTSILDNVSNQGLPEALTGPVKRGDAQTLRRHMEELKRRLPEELELYRAGTRATIETAAACKDSPLAELLEKMKAATDS